VKQLTLLLFIARPTSLPNKYEARLIMPDKDDSSRFEQSVDNEEEVLRHLVGVTDGDGVGDVDIRLDVPAKLLLL
jgi:hypothetical protein